MEWLWEKIKEMLDLIHDYYEDSEDLVGKTIDKIDDTIDKKE